MKVFTTPSLTTLATLIVLADDLAGETLRSTPLGSLDPATILLRLTQRGSFIPVAALRTARQF